MIDNQAIVPPHSCPGMPVQDYCVERGWVNTSFIIYVPSVSIFRLIESSYCSSTFLPGQARAGLLFWRSPLYFLLRQSEHCIWQSIVLLNSRPIRTLHLTINCFTKFPWILSGHAWVFALYFYKQNFFDWELWVKWLLCCGVFLDGGVLFLSGYILQVMSGSSMSAWMHNPGNL